MDFINLEAFFLSSVHVKMIQFVPERTELFFFLFYVRYKYMESLVLCSSYDKHAINDQLLHINKYFSSCVVHREFFTHHTCKVFFFLHKFFFSYQFFCRFTNKLKLLSFYLSLLFCRVFFFNPISQSRDSSVCFVLFLNRNGFYFQFYQHYLNQSLELTNL